MWNWSIALVLLTQAPVDDPPCGVISVYVALSALDAEITLEAVAAKLGSPARGHSLAELSEFIQAQGYQTLGVNTTLDHLARRPGRFACIAQVGDHHFAVIQKVEAGAVHLIDPPKSYRIAAEVWEKTWSVNALLISRYPLPNEAEVAALPAAADAFVVPQQMSAWRSTWVWLAGGLLVAGVSWLVRSRFA